MLILYNCICIDMNNEYSKLDVVHYNVYISFLKYILLKLLNESFDNTICIILYRIFLSNRSKNIMTKAKYEIF